MDEYSDDGLDGLNSAVLQELENNAIQFTQARSLAHSQVPPRTQQPPESRHGLDFEDDDLDDTEVVNGLLGAGAAPAPTTVPGAAILPNKRPFQRPSPQVHPGHRFPVPSTARDTSLPPQRLQSTQGYPIRPTGSQFTRPAVPPPSRDGFGPSQRPQIQPDASNDIVAALQRRVRALELELNSAKGEAAIIRSNSSKAREEYTGEIVRLKKLNAEQEAKNQRIMEAAVAKEKHATTELQFLQRDMQEANARAKRREGAAVSKPPGAPPGATTPKKTHKAWAMADGFEDLDMIPSPTRSRGKSRDGGAVAAPLGERTPTRNKRKRAIMDSPVKALETSEGDVTMGAAVATTNAGVPPSLAPTALPIEFLPLVLDHGTSYGEPPTFDILSRYSFPSDPATSFAAYIYQRLPLLGNPHNPLQLLVDFSRLILAMWEKCLGEEFFRPIWDLTSLLAFTLQLDTRSVAPHIINELLPVAEQSIYKIADHRYQSAGGDLSSDPVADALQQQIDTTNILSIVHLVAMACVTSIARTEQGMQTRQAEFWRMVPMDLVLMLLTPKQRLDDILIMLDMLCTSALPASLGPLTADRLPELGARMVIEKVSANLVDLPKAASTPRQRHAVAQAVLRALGSFARTSFGALQIASHVQAIPRLVTTLSSLIDELYDMTDSVPISAEKRMCVDKTGHGPEGRPADSGHDEDWEGLHRLIKQVVSLLHRLVTANDTSKAADIQSKLAGAHGGPQRYILALSRIHFAEEDLVYEAGIDEATADMARELCEYVVTPDEGEGVREAFGA